MYKYSIKLIKIKKNYLLNSAVPMYPYNKKQLIKVNSHIILINL